MYVGKLDVLLSDEPFVALQAQTRDASQDDLLRIGKSTGTMVILVRHSIDEAIYLGQGVFESSAHGVASSRIFSLVPSWESPSCDARHACVRR
ncbi:sulfonate ABC transporter ATP-binding protein [Caballeronia arationis]|jgi:ABC-type nitrate/sulfonate/bicarbonate transport system ATPase subunit|uniref:hypothetical protein n=1 Tax=Caballeronia arationis TaxID=1777142 RepID=UPI00074C7081|nr:hypothetical protein [Caballeronia arationis]SAK90583.1 sulfonate ABC transporter ATP-binding protein [Caballeronia arationis]